jgi:hypothetical protein
MHESDDLPVVIENWSSPQDLVRQLQPLCKLPVVCDLTWRSGKTAAVVLVAAGEEGLITESWDPATEEGNGDLHVVDMRDLLRIEVP